MKKILIVEDDVQIARSLTVRLKAEGYDVRTATDGLTGVMTAVKEPPDLVILDIFMPAGGGFGVAERIQGLNQTMGVPMIFLTASRRPDLREKAEQLGAYAFLEKPFESGDLLNAVKGALGDLAPAPGA